MFEFNAKRQRIMASFFCFSFSLVIMVSCMAPVTISGLVAQTNTVLSLIELAQRLSVLTSNSVNSSYQDLDEQIHNKTFSNPTIQAMEVKYSDMSAKHDKLIASLNNTSTEANQLFSMLKSNADENSTPEFQSKMLNDISTNRKAFDEKISVAEGVSSKIKVSIKKYKDILGLLQNDATLKDVDIYIETIDKTIANAKLLDRDVRTALVEGREIITQYEHTSSQKSNDDVATPHSSTTTPPTPKEE